MSGSYRIESNLDNVLNHMKTSKEDFLEAVGLFIQGKAQALCAVDTGDLRRSIEYKVDADESRVDIGVNPSLHNVDYGKYVEFGTSKMDAQPFLNPAVQQNISTLRNMAGGTYE